MGKYLGGFQVGDVVPVTVQCHDGSRVPTDPSAAPTVRVYSAAGSTIETDLKMSRHPHRGETGLFLLRLFLDGDYSEGHYEVRVAYTVSVARRPRFRFQVLPGGNAKGAYRALAYYDKTGGDYLVGETDSNELEIRRGPYL